jgi:DNA-binding NarL/FixJ family response regulator
VADGSTLELGAAALYAHDQLQVARARLASQTAAPDGPGDLSRREVQVLLLVADGLTTREIADRLYISPKTADHHIQHIYTKIGVSNRAAATLWAFQHAIVV